MCQKKLCKKCGNKLWKWGKRKSGTQQYHCHACKSNEVRKRPDQVKRNYEKYFKVWLSGKLTLGEIAWKLKIHPVTLCRKFKEYGFNAPDKIEINIENQVIIGDGYYLSKQQCVLIIILATGKPVLWIFASTENYLSWSLIFNQLKQIPFGFVGDGQKGMAKALKERFPNIVFQRCQFHVIYYCLLKLTRNPETLAAQQFGELVINIAKVKTRSQLSSWLINFKNWYQTNQYFLQEKTYQDETTIRGRMKWHYTHGRLHAAFSHLKRAFPYLFQYLKFSQLPNTSNRIESLNAQISKHLLFHNGSPLSTRQQIISFYLSEQQLKTQPKR